MQIYGDNACVTSILHRQTGIEHFDLSQVLYSLKVLRIKIQYLPNSAQNQIFTDTVFMFKSCTTTPSHVPAHGQCW